MLYIERQIYKQQDRQKDSRKDRPKDRWTDRLTVLSEQEELCFKVSDRESGRQTPSQTSIGWTSLHATLMQLYLLFQRNKRFFTLFMKVTADDYMWVGIRNGACRWIKMETWNEKYGKSIMPNKIAAGKETDRWNKNLIQEKSTEELVHICDMRKKTQIELTVRVVCLSHLNSISEFPSQGCHVQPRWSGTVSGQPCK